MNIPHIQHELQETQKSMREALDLFSRKPMGFLRGHRNIQDRYRDVAKALSAYHKAAVEHASGKHVDLHAKTKDVDHALERLEAAFGIAETRFKDMHHRINHLRHNLH